MSGLNETWVPVKDWNGRFEVSNLSRIRTVLNSKLEPCEPIIKKSFLRYSGYNCIGIMVKTYSRIVKIDKLIADAFIPNPENHNQVIHINGDKSDDRLSNLKYGVLKKLPVRDEFTGSWKPKTIPDFIQEYVDKNDPSGCWIWRGSLTTHKPSYGQLSINGVVKKAHREIYKFIKNINLKSHEFCCHRCDNTICVNPDHIFVGSLQDNVNDMVSKKRHSFGGRSVSSKLTESDVRNILENKDKLSNKELSDLFKVSQQHIIRVKTGESWKHLKQQ